MSLNHVVYKHIYISYIHGCSGYINYQSTNNSLDKLIILVFQSSKKIPSDTFNVSLVCTTVQNQKMQLAITED